MNINITVDGRSLRTVARRGMILCALLLTTTVSAVPTTWNADDVLTADDLNGNFADVDARILAAENATPILTAWASYTPTFTTNAGVAVAGTTSIGSWRRVGDSVEVRIGTTFAGPPQSGAVWWHWSLPPGLTVDSAKLSYGQPLSTANHVGAGMAGKGVNNNTMLAVYVRSTTTVSATAHGAPVYYISDSVPFAWSLDDGMAIKFTVPIAGWDVTN